MDKTSESNDTATSQQLVAENASLLEAKVSAEKSAATLSSQVDFFTVFLSNNAKLLMYPVLCPSYMTIFTAYTAYS